MPKKSEKFELLYNLLQLLSEKRCKISEIHGAIGYYSNDTTMRLFQVLIDKNFIGVEDTGKFSPKGKIYVYFLVEKGMNLFNYLSELQEEKVLINNVPPTKIK